MKVDDCMTNNYDISFVVLTYKPVFEKLKATLNSLISQKDINFQIVISDDGSADNKFNRVKKYFSDNNFYNYKLIDHKKNQGTVSNFYDALMECSASRVKLISPGDEIIGDNTIRKWIDSMVLSRRCWSFSKVSNYYCKDGKKVFVDTNHNPLDIAYYRNDKMSTARFNYIVFSDNVNGASVICDKELYVKYVKKLIGQVIFCEDLVYYLFMLDNICPYYFDCSAIAYECDSGISNSNNEEWNLRLKKDKDCIYRLLLESDSGDNVSKKILNILRYPHRMLDYKYALSKGYLFKRIRWALVWKINNILEKRK